MHSISRRRAHLRSYTKDVGFWKLYYGTFNITELEYGTFVSSFPSFRNDCCVQGTHFLYR